MGNWGRWSTVGGATVMVAAMVWGNRNNKEEVFRVFVDVRDGLGIWAMPLYVFAHTLTLSLCLPYAFFFEAAASLLFGFFPSLLCVFSAKVLGASLSFLIGRIVLRSSSSAMGWARSNKYFHMLSRGVERDGWKFVILARFSPIPSYVINYALAATNIGFIVDFLFPTVVGCIPMILQNTSIGSLAGAAVSSPTASQTSLVWSYVFPLLGISSSILISLRIKKYSTSHIPNVEDITDHSSHNFSDAVDLKKSQ